MTTAPIIAPVPAQQGGTRTSAARLARVAGRAPSLYGPMALTSSWGSDQPTRLSGRHGGYPTIASADAHRSPSTLRRMAANVQDAIRRHLILKMVVGALLRMIIGPEPDVMFKSSSPAFNAAARAWFERARESNRFEYRRMQSLGEMCEATVMAICDAGRVGWLKVDDGSVQAIESARIVNPESPWGMNTRLYRDGVRVNENGRPIAYHIAEFDEYGTSIKGGQGRVVSFDRLLYLINPYLPSLNQTTSEPLMQAAIEWVDSISFGVSAINAALNQAASVGLVWETPAPAEFQSAMMGLNQEEGTADTDPREQAYGYEVYAPVGTKATQVRAEHPSANHEWFLNSQLRMIAAAYGLPLEAVLFLFNQSFTAHRAAFATAWPGIEKLQNFVEYKLIRHVVRHALAADIRAGAPDLAGVTIPADWRRMECVLPSMPIFDQVAEVDAATKRMEQNLSTLEAETRKLTGMDSGEVLSKRAQEVKMMRTLGIEPPKMPGAKVSGESQEKKETQEQVTE